MLSKWLLIAGIAILLLVLGVFVRTTDAQAYLGHEPATCVDAITAIQAAAKVSDVAPILLDEARTLHRHAQFRWDFVSAENNMGFHNPEEVLRILGDATNLARQAQMKAAQAAHAPSILETGSYYTLPSVPTPVP